MKNFVVLTIMTLLCCGSSGNAGGNGDYVVLLHGLGRSASSMHKIEHYLLDKGFTVVNEGYPSTAHPVEVLAEKHLAGTLARRCTDPGKKIHFVTHSMGGIVLRCYLKNHPLKNPGRTVMIAPPNRGSTAADYYRNVPLVRRVLGPALGQVGTGPDGIAGTLGPLQFEAGVIAGASTIDPFTSTLIPGEDDGRVAVEEAKAENMKDFAVVKSSHAFIMDSAEVMELTLNFLLNGSFGVQRQTLSD